MLFLLDLAIVLHPEFLYLEKKYLPMSDSPVGGTYYPGPGDALLSSSSSLNSLFLYFSLYIYSLSSSSYCIQACGICCLLVEFNNLLVRVTQPTFYLQAITKNVNFLYYVLRNRSADPKCFAPFLLLSYFENTWLLVDTWAGVWCNSFKGGFISSSKPSRSFTERCGDFIESLTATK